MGECQLLRSVMALNNIKQEPHETLINFYMRFHKSVGEIDKQTGDSELCHVFYSSLDPLNKASLKLRNILHMSKTSKP